VSSRGRLVAGGLLALLLLYFFLRGVAWSELVAAFGAADPVLLGLVVPATVVTYVLRAWRWGYLLAPLVRVPLPRLVSATYVGFMTGLLIPRAGEVVRPYLIARRYPVRLSAAFASIILERLVDLLTVLLLLGLYLYVLPLPAAQQRGPLLGVLKTGGLLVGGGALAGLALLLAYHVHAERVMRLVERVLRPLPVRLASLLVATLRSFGEGLAVLKAPPSHLLVIAGQSLLVWLSIALSIHLNNQAFGFELTFQAVFLIIGFLTVGVAIPTPGMVGGFHESYLLALTQAFGVDKGIAAAAGIALHALTNLPVLVLGLALFGSEGLSFGKIAELSAREPREPAPAEVKP